MKDKDPQNMDLSDVLAEIQAFLDNQASQQESSWATTGGIPAGLGLSSTNRSRLPASWTVTRYFLTRHRATSNELLQSLPNDMFIVC